MDGTGPVVLATAGTAAPRLFFGYLPLRSSLIDAYVRDWAAPADRWYPATPLALREVRKLRSFATLAPIDPRSRGRAAVVDLTAAGRREQQALLREIETVPAQARYALSADDLGGVLPTVRSRCHLVHCPVPGYGSLVADLVRFGRDLPSAVRTAALVERGTALSAAPDGEAVQVARQVWRAWTEGALDRSLALLETVTPAALGLLRRALCDRGEWALVAQSYRSHTPQTAVVEVVEAVRRRPARRLD